MTIYEPSTNWELNPKDHIVSAGLPLSLPSIINRGGGGAIYPGQDTTDDNSVSSGEIKAHCVIVRVCHKEIDLGKYLNVDDIWRNPAEIMHIW